MRPPCIGGARICGYGDPSADFHLIGDHAGIHGGTDTHVPFTSSPVGRQIQGLLFDLGFLASPYADRPIVTNLYMNYLYMCPVSPSDRPTRPQYLDHDRFFDAELRAVNAHILLPVGRRATDRVLEAYTTQRRKVPHSMRERHALEVRGRGFLVVPVLDPRAWRAGDRRQIRTTLERILASDYRQTKGVATLVG